MPLRHRDIAPTHDPAHFTFPVFLRDDKQRLGPQIYTEFVGYLFAAVWPVILVTGGYAALSLLVFRLSHDSLILLLGVCGTILGLDHLHLVLRYRHLPSPARRCTDVVAVWEARYTIRSYLFSACLGLLEAELLVNARHVSALGVALLYGFTAGLGARVCMRPRIAIGCLLLSMLPAMIGMAVHNSVQSLSLIGFTIIYIGGAIETISHIYASLVASLSLKYQFEALARHDELTGLPNRLQTRERLTHEIARLPRSGGMLAVHYLDLDHFKAANDKYGHALGDALLQEVGRRLSHLLRVDDVVGRLGGDEFLIIQTGMEHQSEAESLAKRILAAIRQPFAIHGQEISLGTSIGIALAPNDANDMATLIKYADEALYMAKARARSTYAFHKGVGGGGIFTMAHAKSA